MRWYPKSLLALVKSYVARKIDACCAGLMSLVLEEFYAKRPCILTISQIVPWLLLKLEDLFSPLSLVSGLPVQSRSVY